MRVEVIHEEKVRARERPSAVDPADGEIGDQARGPRARVRLGPEAERPAEDPPERSAYRSGGDHAERAPARPRVDPRETTVEPEPLSEEAVVPRDAAHVVAALHEGFGEGGHLGPQGRPAGRPES